MQALYSRETDMNGSSSMIDGDTKTGLNTPSISQARSDANWVKELADAIRSEQDVDISEIEKLVTIIYKYNLVYRYNLELKEIGHNTLTEAWLAWNKETGENKFFKSLDLYRIPNIVHNQIRQMYLKE